MKACAIAVALFAFVANTATALEEQELARLEGIQNCANKCDKVFDRTQYAINDQPGANTFEFRSCIIGCNQCSAELAKNPSSDSCFLFCKNFDYAGQSIRKGVIEPDKACIMGCVINTCQSICFGGTTDFVQTPQNSQFFWNGGGHGCSIKGMLGYVQNPNYGNPNAPAGAGASEAEKQCCTNAFNLCFYNGDTSSINFANVLLVAQRTCSKFVGSTDTNAICAFYNTIQNCGTPGLFPVVSTASPSP